MMVMRDAVEQVKENHCECPPNVQLASGRGHKRRPASDVAIRLAAVQ